MYAPHTLFHARFCPVAPVLKKNTKDVVVQPCGSGGGRPCWCAGAGKYGSHQRPQKPRPPRPSAARTVRAAVHHELGAAYAGQGWAGGGNGAMRQPCRYGGIECWPGFRVSVTGRVGWGNQSGEWKAES